MTIGLHFLSFSFPCLSQKSESEEGSWAQVGGKPVVSYRQSENVQLVWRVMLNIVLNVFSIRLLPMVT